MIVVVVACRACRVNGEEAFFVSSLPTSGIAVVGVRHEVWITSIVSALSCHWTNISASSSSSVGKASLPLGGFSGIHRFPLFPLRPRPCPRLAMLLVVVVLLLIPCPRAVAVSFFFNATACCGLLQPAAACCGLLRSHLPCMMTVASVFEFVCAVLCVL